MSIKIKHQFGEKQEGNIIESTTPAIQSTNSKTTHFLFAAIHLN